MLPMDMIARSPEGHFRTKLVVDGWDDVVAVEVHYRWNEVRRLRLSAIRRRGGSRAHAKVASAHVPCAALGPLLRPPGPPQYDGCRDGAPGTARSKH